MTVKQIAEILRLNPVTVRTKIAKGLIKGRMSTKYGGWFVEEKDFKDYLDKIND